ncbi:MAG TPA: diguanylate cyclase [Solirubrobacteraceae bacterium]|nr:diguanylate cyclase [Solirubrobacteraceae bacterium]
MECVQVSGVFLSIPSSIRAAGAVAFTVAAVSITVVATSSIERTAADRGYRHTLGAQNLLTSMLDRETGLRGFLLTGDDSFLQPYRSGTAHFQTAVRSARAYSQDVPQLSEQVQLAQRWQAEAQRSILRVRRFGVHGSPFSTSQASALRRKRVMDDFRSANARYLSVMNQRRVSGVAAATDLSTWIVVALSLLLATIQLVLVRLGSRRRERNRAVIAAADRARQARERTYVEERRRFAEIVQVSETEAEARALIKRRIESGIADCAVVVLNRNNSADRLETATALAADSALAAALAGATPRACLAIRLGRTHHETRDESPLISCELCGKNAAQATCEPLLVGGQVIGSLLISHEQELDERAQRLIAETVGYTAPVLANLRNLAIAERRAHTDSLTGLPNRRALDDTFKRMLAQASRTVAPLSVVLLDLDHFKRVNDTFGHDRGDEVLAAVAGVLTESVRASDFVARFGGEEFVVLLPATDLQGALRAAENIAQKLATAHTPKLDRLVTASFGVAGFPEHGVDAETLVRYADHALYQAKQDGRNCVRVASDELPALQVSPSSLA